MKSERLAFLALALASLFWAGNFTAGRALRDDIAPLALNTTRWTICLIIFLPFAWRAMWSTRRVIAREWPLLVGLSATGVVGFQTLVYVGLTHTTAINALLIVALVPAVILVGALFVGETRPTGLQWLGAAISTIGVGITVTRGDPHVLTHLKFNVGDLWILAAVVLWAAYSLMLRRRPADLPQDAMLGAIIAMAVVVLVPAAMLTTSFPRLELDGPAWLAVLYISIFPSLLAFRFWSYGVDIIGPERSGYFVQLMPVFGAVLAVALLGETIATPQLVGAVLVLAGIVMVNRKPGR